MLLKTFSNFCFRWKTVQCNIMQNISFQRCVVDIDKSAGCSAGARDTAQIQLQTVGKGIETACSFSSLNCKWILFIISKFCDIEEEMLIQVCCKVAVEMLVM